MTTFSRNVQNLAQNLWIGEKNNGNFGAGMGQGECKMGKSGVWWEWRAIEQ